MKFIDTAIVIAGVASLGAIVFLFGVALWFCIKDRKHPANNHPFYRK